MKNYYEILGVGKTATNEEIKKEFKKMVRKWHPDMNDGSKEAIRMTQLINEAYSILGDASKRKQYDRELVDAKNNYSSNSKSNSDTYDFYESTKAKTDTSSEMDDNSSKLGQHIFDEFKKLNKLANDSYLYLVSNDTMSKNQRIYELSRMLAHLEVFCDCNLILIGLTREKILESNFRNCDVTIFYLKKILLEYEKYLALEQKLKNLKNEYSMKSFSK